MSLDELDHRWSDERRALQESARAFVRTEVAPHLQDWEEAGEVPRTLHRSAAKLGLLGLGIPEAYGGVGGTFLDVLAVIEAFTEVGASSGLLAALFTGGIALPHIVESGNADLVDRFVRPTLAGESIGARSLALAVAYVRERETFGHPLIDNQVVRHTLVEMHRRVDVARNYTREVARRYVAGEPVQAEAVHAKAVSVAAALYVVDRAVQPFGGAGYLHGSEVERHYRDARIVGIGGGATEVLDDLAARLLGYVGEAR
jgi:alkylation response protein AidB-like acyl-CoA dehydrogenase